jgi:polyhydroxybutyrate depolymerase
MTAFNRSLLLGFALSLGASWGQAQMAFAQSAASEQSPQSPLQRFKERRAERQKAQAEAASTQSPAVQMTGPGDYNFTLQHDGVERMYRVHVPTSYSAGKPVALVVAMHGGGGSMDIQANDKYYGQISKSDQAGYVVAFPNGYSRFDSGKLATWNAGNCCGAARDKQVDDVRFIKEMVAQIRTQLNIDPKRIYADGMSNGGLMSYRLACELPQMFSAIAAVAGTDNTKVCTPTQPVSILHIHAKDDDHVLFNGGSGRKSTQETDFVSVPATIAKWVKINSCNSTPKRVLSVSGAYCDAYASCSGGTEVKLCVTETGGHSWPGGTKVRGGAQGSSALSATDMIWDFFESH